MFQTTRGDPRNEADWCFLGELLRDTVANTICSTAQLRADSKSYLCQWGEYAFNEQGANVDQFGVHGTTEAVLALGRMLDTEEGRVTLPLVSIVDTRALANGGNLRSTQMISSAQ